jgi:hypothetical protein
MKEIGGFFELELKSGKEYHSKALKLNTARNCLEYIIKAKEIRKVYLPYYICDVIFEPIRKLNINSEFYNIDSQFDPLFNKKLERNEAFLYVNHFGIKSKTILNFKNRFNNVIIDNAQAFYTEPFNEFDTFYSPRKFFGVPDGAYLYTNNYLDENFEDDVSYSRVRHLIKRIDVSAESAYEYFLENEKSLCNQPIKKMSKFAQSILKSIDYEHIKIVRKRNFLSLHSHLKDINELNINIDEENCPMVYPLLISNDGLREYLIQNKIYVPTYWKNVLDWVDESSFEYKLAKYLLPLPIDQRYNITECKYLVKLIQQKIK